MPGRWSIAATLFAAILLQSAIAWYVSKRAGWAFSLPLRAQRLLAATFTLGIVAAMTSRLLGPDFAALARPLGLAGSAIVLGVLISALLLLPFELGRGVWWWLRRRTTASSNAAPSHPAAPELAEGTERAAGTSPAERATAVVDETTRRAFLAQTVVGGALSLGMGSAVYGTLYGRRDYTVETVPIRLQKLPKTLDGLTVVQLSDLHVGTYVGERELGAALELVRTAKPDLVVLTGDLLDHDLHYAPVLARFTRALESRARYGVFAIPGNHDYYAGAAEVLRVLRQAGAEVLLNRHVRIGEGASSLILAGLDDVYGPFYDSPGPHLDAAFDGAPEELARVLLSHNPTYFRRSHRYADLTLSGHTHGGQITMFINPAKLVLRHGLVRGHYTVDGSQLYVNRGFGTAGPPARIGSPPEITRLVLTS